MIEKKRLFLAIDIHPSDTYQQLFEKLKHKLRFDMISWIEPQSAHLTLKFFGETPNTRIDSILKSIECAVVSQSPFEFSIDKVGAFGSKHSPKVIWLGVENDKAIRLLHQDVMQSIRKIGYFPDPGNFVPHITLARVKKVEDKDWFWKSIAEFQSQTIQQVVVDKVVLYESILTKKGANHNIIKEFPFST